MFATKNPPTILPQVQSSNAKLIYIATPKVKVRPLEPSYPLFPVYLL